MSIPALFQPRFNMGGMSKGKKYPRSQEAWRVERNETESRVLRLRMLESNMDRE